MKKATIAKLGTVLFVTIWLISSGSLSKAETEPQARKTSRNLIVNGSFEQEDELGLGVAAGWQPRNPLAWMKLDAEVYHSGKSSLKVAPPGEAGIVENWHQEVPVEPGKKYLFSFWCKSENLKQKDTAYNNVRILDKEGKTLKTIYVSTRPIEGSADWKKLAKLIAVPAGTGKAVVTLGTYLATGTVWYDDVCLKDIELARSVKKYSLTLPAKGLAGTKGEPGYLKVKLQVKQRWTTCIFGPKKTVKHPKVPKTISIFMTPESSRALKPHVLIKDADGELFRFLYLLDTKSLQSEGEARVVQLKDGELDNLSETLVNGTIDPPVEFFGLDFLCRTPTRLSIIIGNISFDDQVVENFSQETGWQAIEVHPGANLKLKHLRSRKKIILTAPIRPGHPNEWKFPATLTNFIPSGRFEQGKGTPAGWYHGDAGHIPLDEEGEPVDDPAKHKASYGWENEGVQGFRSMSIEVTRPDCWGGWDYQLKGIKPNTVYTISFWYRQHSPGSLRLHIFGQTITLTDMYRDSPMHWIRYSEHFNSGDFSGEVNIGFHTSYLQEPVKVWLDEVELYEGFSPIGYNICQMQYYYYNHILVSPDAVSPLGFAFEHLFDDDHQPREIDYILELPEGVKLEAFWATYYTWHPEHHRLRKEKIEIAGKPYTRYIMTLMIRAETRHQGDYKTRNHLVTIPKRDGWGNCVGGYSGVKGIHCWLSTTLKSGEVKGHYYARWVSKSGKYKGQQSPQTLNLKVVRVPEVKFKHFRVWAQAEGPDFPTYPSFAEAYTRVGINGLVGSGSAEQNQAVKKLGIRDIHIWCNQPVYSAGDDPTAQGMGLDGKRGGSHQGWCLSYRGQKWQEQVKKAKKQIDAGVTGFNFDDYFLCSCYCPECKKEFKKFLQKFTRLPYKDPVEFMSKPSSQPEYETLWKEFGIYYYGITAKALKSELEKYVREKNLPGKIALTKGCGAEVYEHPFALAGCLEAFDFWSGQHYIHCYYSAYQGSPKRVGDRIAAAHSKMGQYAMNFAPLLAPGLVYMHPACAIAPYEVMKYQILEAVFAVPIKGYAVYAGRDIDLGILLNMGAANRIISAYEDIIMDGKIVTSGLKGAGPKGNVRAKKLGERMLVLVSDYSTFAPQKTTLKISIPPVQKNSLLTDVESGKKIAELAAGQGDFQVELNANRARVFLCEPR